MILGPDVAPLKHFDDAGLFGFHFGNRLLTGIELLLFCFELRRFVLMMLWAGILYVTFDPEGSGRGNRIMSAIEEPLNSLRMRRLALINKNAIWWKDKNRNEKQKSRF